MIQHSRYLKTILHSKRANIYYLEHCRILVNGGRVEYLTQDDDKQSYWNIPIANTTVLLLGTGTSITQAAVRLLAAAGVMIGFCGGGGTPLIAATEIEWLSPQSEYRPTEYVQKWLSFWFDSDVRLQAARFLQKTRLKYIRYAWGEEELFQEHGFYPDEMEIEQALDNAFKEIDSAENSQQLLTVEGRLAKKIYKFAAQCTEQDGFHRDHAGGDKVNTFLNHGNYLAYGLAATALWVLGIPHGFALMHGKTRRGALVFDIADIIKDGLVLPTAFICAFQGDREQEFRDTLIDIFMRHQAMQKMIETIKEICLKFGREIQ